MNLQEKIVRGWDISAEGYSKRVVQNDCKIRCDFWYICLKMRGLS